MACETIVREFEKSDGSTMVASVRQLPASKSLELHIDLINKLGNAIFPFIEDKYNFSDILNTMRSNKSDVVMQLIKQVVCTANIDGKEFSPPLFDVVFNREEMLIFKVFAFVLEANYMDFFRQGLEMNESRRLEVEEASKKESLHLKNQLPNSHSNKNSQT